MKCLAASFQMSEHTRGPQKPLGFTAFATALYTFSISFGPFVLCSLFLAPVTLLCKVKHEGERSESRVQC